MDQDEEEGVKRYYELVQFYETIKEKLSEHNLEFLHKRSALEDARTVEGIKQYARDVLRDLKEIDRAVNQLSGTVEDLFGLDLEFDTPDLSESPHVLFDELHERYYELFDEEVEVDEISMGFSSLTEGLTEMGEQLRSAADKAQKDVQSDEESIQPTMNRSSGEGSWGRRLALAVLLAGGASLIIWLALKR